MRASAAQVTVTCSTLPDEQLSRDAEQAAQQKATGLLSDAVTAFRQASPVWSTSPAKMLLHFSPCRLVTGRCSERQTRQPHVLPASGRWKQAKAVSFHNARQVMEGTPQAMRVDALVATGNALASAADMAATAEAALHLLHGAGEAYAAALAQEEDSGTLSNAADAWVAAARRLGETGRRQEAAALFSQAMAAYQRSCELSRSEEGDDLPGKAFWRACHADADATAHSRRHRYRLIKPSTPVEAQFSRTEPSVCDWEATRCGYGMLESTQASGLQVSCTTGALACMS